MLNGFFKNLSNDFIYNNELSYYNNSKLMEEESYVLNRYNIPNYFYNIEDPYDACYESMLINQQNYHNIISSVAVMEMQHLKNNNQIIYEEVISNIFDKIRDFLGAAWEKLKNIYENVLDLFRSGRGIGGSSSKNSSISNENSLPKSVTLNDVYDINHKAISDTSFYTDLKDTIVSTIRDVYDYGLKNSNNINEYKKSIKQTRQDKSAMEFICQGTFMCKNLKEYYEIIEKDFGIFEIVNEVKLETLEIKKCLEKNTDNINSINAVYNSCKKTMDITKQLVSKAKSRCTSNKSVDRSSFGFLIELCNATVTILSGMQSRQIKACKIYESQCREAAKQIGLL